jgi:MFS family permease
VFSACFLMVFIALGFCSSNKGLYLAAITEDMGIARSLFSFNDSCRFIVTAVMNLFFGRWVIKMGPRRMISFGFLFLIASCSIYSFSQNIFMFYLGGCFLGAGLAWTTTTIVGFLVEKWFTKNKGTIMGIILAANGVGVAVGSQIVSRIIYSSESGWRNSYGFTAILLAVVGTIIVLLIRNKPEDVGQQPLGIDRTEKAKRGLNWEGIAFEDARRKPYFYVAAVCIFFTGLILQSCVSVSSAHMKDIGLDTNYIATVLSVHSLLLAAAKMLTGFCFDKFGLRKTMLSCNLCAMIALLLLAFISNNAMAMGYGVFAAFGLPLETIMLPLIASDLFGRKSHAKIMGLFISFNTMGYALGVPLANFFFDRTGSYKTILVGLACLMLMVTVVMQRVISAAKRNREAAIAANLI